MFGSQQTHGGDDSQQEGIDEVAVAGMGVRVGRFSQRKSIFCFTRSKKRIVVQKKNNVYFMILKVKLFVLFLL